MNKDHAKSIWQFVKQWQEKVETIVVHCEQGMSRSPAVAAAICKTLGGDDSWLFREYMPNPFVYDVLVGIANAVHGTRTTGGNPFNG